MELFDDLLQRAAGYKLHNIEWQSTVVLGQLVHRHDAGVFHLAGDLCLGQKSITLFGTIVTDFFQRHFATNFAVIRDPNLSHATSCVKSLDRILTRPYFWD